MHDTALAAISVPDATDPADFPTHAAGMVADLEPKLIIPKTHAQRVAIASPTNGLTVYETDTGKIFEYHTNSPTGVTGWYPPWNTAWGVLASTSDNVKRSGFYGTATEIYSGLRGAITIPGGRRIKVSVRAHVIADAGANANCVGLGEIYDNGSTTGRRWCSGTPSSAGNNYGSSWFGWAEYTPTAGSHSYSPWFQTIGSGGLADVRGDVDPTQVEVEDMGPAAGPF